jgi:helix-turn-helix protein
MALDKPVGTGIGAARASAARPATEGASSEAVGANLIPFRPGSASVAQALNAARRNRGETLKTASEGSGLPLRYLAAFESDGAPLVFRTPEAAQPFLLEYARYLQVDLEAVAARVHRDLGSTAVGRAPPTPVARIARPPGKGGRARRAGFRRSHRAGGGSRSPMTTALLLTAFIGIVGLSARVVSGAIDDKGVTPPATLTGAAAAKGRPPELPGGGRRLFPDHFVVALYGSPLTHRLGRLGLGPPSFAAEVLKEQALAYKGTRRVLPALEVVATVARDNPGPDGSFTNLLSEDVIQAYLDQARAIRGLLVIDVQPGRRSFWHHVPRYARFLKEPDVGLALDPEWRVGPGQIPGHTLGHVSAGELNKVIDYVAGIVRQYRLPQKLLVIHQFTPFMIRDRHKVHIPPEVAVTFDFDGVGGRDAKIGNYFDLSPGPKGSHQGIKLYYTNDVGLLSPREILALQPQPDIVIYQ